jgi:phage terminase small subunit
MSEPRKSADEKYRIFIEEYLKDLNATRAAMAAGYSQKGAAVQGSRLLRVPKIAAALQAAMDKRSKKTNITAERVLEEIAHVAFSRMSKVTRWNESGVRILASDEMEEHDIAAIQEITENVNEHGGSVKVKLYDKIRALDLLGKHLKLFTGAEVDEDIRRIAEIYDRLKKSEPAK